MELTSHRCTAAKSHIRCNGRLSQVHMYQIQAVYGRGKRLHQNYGRQQRMLEQRGQDWWPSGRESSGSRLSDAKGHRDT